LEVDTDDIFGLKHGGLAPQQSGLLCRQGEVWGTDLALCSLGIPNVTRVAFFWERLRSTRSVIRNVKDEAIATEHAKVAASTSNAVLGAVVALVDGSVVELVVGTHGGVAVGFARSEVPVARVTHLASVRVTRAAVVSACNTIPVIHV